MTAKITPTIFVNTVEALQERLELYEAITKRVQIDVADKSFTVNPTIAVEKSLSQPTTIKRDMHLMVEEPIEYLETCAQAGVSLVIGHIENMSDQKEFVQRARELGVGVGLAVDLDTPMNDLDWTVAKTADLILIMAVRAGKEGQLFNRKVLERIQWLRKKGFTGEICVDGGVNETTIKPCVKAGADVLAVGSCLWKAADPAAKLHQLQELIHAF